jgi:hypothetical protein
MTTISNKNTLHNEQIKNKQVSIIFFKKLKTFLEKDDYNLFKTRSKRNLIKQIRIIEKQIHKLLTLKIRSDKAIKELETKKKILLASNSKLKKEIIRKLELEVK